MQGKSGWNQNPDYAAYVAEAAKRGLTVNVCRREKWEWAPAEWLPPFVGKNGSGSSEQGAFLEAAFFFITGVDAASDEIFNNREIALHGYPIVAYLVDDDSCVLRLRTTAQPYVVWQMHFCRITHYKQHGGVIYWFGFNNAFCTYRGWNENENYTGPIREPDSKCGLLGGDVEDFA